MDNIEILLVRSDEKIAATFDVMHPLRPHLQRDEYVATMRALQAAARQVFPRPVCGVKAGTCAPRRTPD